MTEWNAGDYHKQSTLQAVLAQEHLGKLALADWERVLDVGCGDGKITATIATRVPRGSVLGVDPSHQMIDYAASHFGPPAQPNLRFEVADARSLPYHAEFDRVVSFYALHWVPEQEAALRSIRAALKPSGTTLLQFVAQGERRSIEDVIEETRQAARWEGYFTGFRKPYFHPTPDEYAALARRSGFQILRINVEDKAWDFETRERFVAFCRATFVEWNQHLPESERDSFINDVLDRYRTIAARTPQEANTFKFFQMDVVLTPREAGEPASAPASR